MTAKLQLVVVEDNVIDAELVARHLAKAGLDVVMHRVQTESELVSALHEKRPDLILSDFSLPQFSGLRALDVARANAPETPFIYVSGTIGEERAIDALRRGATDYVLKTNLSRLSSAVERALREAALKADQRKSEQQRREQEVRLQRLTRTYRMLSSTSSAILRLRNRTELLDEVCRIAVQQGGYERVSISLIDAGTKMLRQRSCAGPDPQRLRGSDYAVLASGTHSGMAERAIGSGLPSIHNDIAGEQQSAQQHELLIALDYRALAALPLLIDGTAIGVITLFSKQPSVFDAAEVNLLLEM